MTSPKAQLVLALVAFLSLTGSECVFVAKSGGGSDDPKDEEDANLIVIVESGQLIDGPVQGLRYVSGSLSGYTGPGGEFDYQEGGLVRFYLGDLPLGRAVTGKSIVTPLDLVPNGQIDNPAVINIARLLQSLDSDPTDGRISIPTYMHEMAVLSSPDLGAWISSLDFADEAAFVNAASQLVAALTADYDFTAVLVDREHARGHLETSLATWGVSASDSSGAALF